MIRFAPILLLFCSGLLVGQDSDDLFKHPTTTAENEALQVIGQRLQEIQVLRANFTQEKHITALKRPLKSKGIFLFGAEHGLTWQVTRPFPTTFIVTPQGIMQQMDGGDTIKIEAEERPVISSFTRMFLLLFRGDTQVMEERFQLFFKGDAANWTIGLKPKGLFLKKVMDHIIIQGETHMTRLTLAEASGDRTLIQFLDTATEPALSEEELARFAF